MIYDSNTQNRLSVYSYCLVIDIIGSTDAILKVSTPVRDSFNLALLQALNLLLKKMELEDAYVKFTGDGWVINIEKANKLINLICLALLLKKKFSKLIRELTEISFPQKWDLRLALSSGVDIKVDFNRQIDFIGDSIRRATRVSTLCFPNEILVDFSVYRDTQRDFEYQEVEVDNRTIQLGIKKFEHDIGKLLYMVNEAKYSELANAATVLVYFNEVGLYKEEEKIISSVSEKAGDKNLSTAKMETIDRTSIALTSIGKFHESKVIYSKLIEHGYERSLVYWNKELNLIRDYNTAIGVLQLIKDSGVSPNNISYTILLKKAVDFEQGKEVLMKMKNEGINPDVVTYTTLLKKTMDFEQGKEMLVKMKDEGINPDVVTYITLLKKTIDFEQGKEMLVKMKDEGIRPNEVIFNMLLNKANNFEQKKEVLAEMKAEGIRLDVVTYITLLHKAVSLEQRKVILEEMKAEGIRPNEVTLNRLLDKAVNLEQGKELLEEMKAEGIRPDEVTFNTLLNKTVNLEQGKELLEEMKTEGIRPDVVTFTTLLNKAVNLEQGKEVLAEMKAEKISPDEVTFNILLNKVVGFDQGKELLAEMKAEGIRPDEVTFNTLLNKVVGFEQGKELLAEMKAEGISPDIITYTTLLNKVVGFEQGKELLAEMKAEGIRPNEVTFCTLFTKDIESYTAKQIHLWYVKEQKYHPANAIPALISNMWKRQRLADVFYLIIHYPHLQISKEIVEKNFDLTISMYNEFSKENYYDKHINYALGLAYFGQNDYLKSKIYLELALKETDILKQKQNVEELLSSISKRL